MKFVTILFSIALGVLILVPGIGASETRKKSTAKVSKEFYER